MSTWRRPSPTSPASRLPPTGRGAVCSMPVVAPRAYFYVAEDHFTLGVREEQWKYTVRSARRREELYRSEPRSVGAAQPRRTAAGALRAAAATAGGVDGRQPPAVRQSRHPAAIPIRRVTRAQSPRGIRRPRGSALRHDRRPGEKARRPAAGARRRLGAERRSVPEHLPAVPVAADGHPQRQHPDRGRTADPQRRDPAARRQDRRGRRHRRRAGRRSGDRRRGQVRDARNHRRPFAPRRLRRAGRRRAQRRQRGDEPVDAAGLGGALGLAAGSAVSAQPRRWRDDAAGAARVGQPDRRTQRRAQGRARRAPCRG